MADVEQPVPAPAVAAADATPSESSPPSKKSEKKSKAPKGDTSIPLTEVLPEKGLIYSESKDLMPLLCKPKLLPIKSYSLERLEVLEKKIAKEEKERREKEKEAKKAAEWK